MSQPASSSSKTSAVPADKAQLLPFLLTVQQGEAARVLLNYVASLPLPGPAAQLLAVVVAVRAARGGVGHLTGSDLSALRLGDSREAVDALRSLGWELDDAVFDDDPAAPAGTVTVPYLTREKDHPLPFGKQMRSRVSGWTTRVLSAKPVKKLPPAARLAALLLAAHGTSTLLGQIPPGLPEACRTALPDLLDKGFLADLSGDRYRLDPCVRHLAGMRPATDEEKATAPSTARFTTSSADAWARWKTAGTPALRRHVECVEHCTLCALPRERVAEAFMLPSRPQFFSKATTAAYVQWKDAHPGRGPQSASFTVAFRAEHGHGPSFRQLFDGLGWKSNHHQLRSYVVRRLLSNGWLTNTGTVPWTLRPGAAAQEQGITLPSARNPALTVGLR